MANRQNERVEAAAGEMIRELALTNSLTDSYLLLQDIRDLKGSLSLELDLARDRRLAQEKEFQTFMNEMYATLREIQARFRVEAQLLSLIRPNKAEQQPLTTNGNREDGTIKVNFVGSS